MVETRDLMRGLQGDDDGSDLKRKVTFRRPESQFRDPATPPFIDILFSLQNSEGLVGFLGNLTGFLFLFKSYSYKELLARS